MGKLYKAFMGIDAARKHCIQNLRQGGVTINNDATLDEVATKILEGPNPAPYGEIWTRPQEWVDTESILDNAPVHEGYRAYAIALLDDETDELSIDFINNYCLDGYHLSDGTWLAQDTSSKVTQTHTWDKSKDIVTTLPYKQRYVIFYINTTLSKARYGISNTAYNNKLAKDMLEFICKNINKIDLDPNDPDQVMTLVHPIIGTTDPVYGSKFKRLVIDSDLNLYSNSNTVSFLKEVLMTKAGFKGMRNLQYYADLLKISEVTDLEIEGAAGYNIPKTKVLDLKDVINLTYSGNGSVVEGCYYFNAPKLENCTPVLSNVFYINAPLLKTVTKIQNYNNNILTLTNLESLTSFNSSSYMHSRVNFPKLTTLLENISAEEIYVKTLITVTQDTAFNYTYLKELRVGNGFNHSLSLSSCKYLSKESVLDLFNKVATVTEGQYIQLHTNVKNNLTEEEKAIVTNKGWVIK